jgi:hypothetical protein
VSLDGVIVCGGQTNGKENIAYDFKVLSYLMLRSICLAQVLLEEK